MITNEVYETPLRSSGMGLTNALGRLATVLMPFILITVFDLQRLAPFLLFSVVASICMIMAKLLPFDTTNIILDHVDGERGEQIK